MKRRFLAVFLVLVSVFALSSCGKKTDTVTDNNGNKLVIKKDKNNFASTDEKGDLIVYETDSKGRVKQNADGEDVTSTVNFPSFIKNDKYVECEYFYFELPEGWQVQKGHTIKIFNEESQAEIAFTVRSTDSVDDCLKQIKDLYSDWGANWKETEEDLGFAKAKVISSSKLIENYEKSYYVFAIEDSTYAISTSFNTKLTQSVDFVSVIKNVTFKKAS